MPENISMREEKAMFITEAESFKVLNTVFFVSKRAALVTKIDLIFFQHASVLIIK